VLKTVCKPRPVAEGAEAGLPAVPPPEQPPRRAERQRERQPRPEEQPQGRPQLQEVRPQARPRQARRPPSRQSTEFPQGACNRPSAAFSRPMGPLNLRAERSRPLPQVESCRRCLRAASFRVNRREE
jgi:hypothetical protein